MRTGPALAAMRRLPALKTQPTIESQTQMLADWSQWLTNAMAFRSRTFATTDDVLNAWEPLQRPAFRAQSFFQSMSISRCDPVFPADG